MADEAEKPVVAQTGAEVMASFDAIANAASTVEEAKKKRAKGKSGTHVTSGIAHVEASFNNTKVYITDNRGNVVGWCSAGRLGFKGSKKSTAYVGQLVGADAAKRAAALGMREIQVRIFGPGAGRESAVRGVVSAGIDVTAIEDVTPVPHNGCRPPKRRRI